MKVRGEPVHDHLVDLLDFADLELLDGRCVTQVGTQVRNSGGGALLVGRVRRPNRIIGLDHVRDLGLAYDVDVKELMEKGVEKAKKRRKGSGEREQYKEGIEGGTKNLSAVVKIALKIPPPPRAAPLELYLVKVRGGPVHDHLVDLHDGVDLELLDGRRVTQVGTQVRNSEEEVLAGRVY
jgi:hypothetical protein